MTNKDERIIDFRKAKKQKLDPIRVNKDNFFYRDKDDLIIIHTVYDSYGRYTHTAIIEIPWSKLK
jgi:hypothetical protein